MPKGFSLVELMIVISVVVILSTIGLNVYRGTSKSGNDAKVKNDVDAISSAYEVGYDPRLKTYNPISNASFTGESIPKHPSGDNYIFDEGPGVTGVSIVVRVPNPKAFRICGILQGGATADCNPDSVTDKCYCRVSAHGLTATPAL